MTALVQYQRLESTGLWRPEPDAQRREVVVSFGEASLVFRDARSDQALSHWSLAAVLRRNPGQMPAIFVPDSTDDSETLELEDAVMIDAISKVQASIQARKPHPWRLRVAVVAVTTALIGAAVWWGVPKALYSQTAQALPFASRLELGRAGLRAMAPYTGQPCAAPEGTAALRKLAQRLNAAGTMQLVVLRDGVHGVVRLPGRLLLLDRRLIERQDTPDVLAGHILHALLRDWPDPVEELLAKAGPIATLRTLTTGEIPVDALADYARDKLRAPVPDVPEDKLIGLFAVTGVASTPYALSIDPTGRAVRNLIDADPMAATDAVAPAVLTQVDWVQLQAICE